MRRRRWPRLLAGFLALAATGLVAYVAGLGYFGGPVETLVAAPAPRRDGVVAVFVSGDMGFNTGMGPRIVARLADAGVPVVAVNALTAFARQRTRTEAQAIVARAVAHAARLPGARRVVLIGQSFGANVALAGASGLPPPLRARLSLLALIVPGETTAFHAAPGGIVDLSDDGPALAYAARVTRLPVLCIHGDSETHSLCPSWRSPDVTPVALPGGHFLREDDALVAATLLRAIG